MTPGTRTGTSDRASAIFFSLSRAPKHEHQRLIDEQCAGDMELRRQVERLLESVDLQADAPEAEAPRLSQFGDVLHRPGSAIADFDIVQPIGSGGTGVVYLAHQRHPPRIVALKVLRQEFVASRVQRRFELEAELLGHLHHPGIAQIYNAHPGDSDTPPFIAMELVDGPPLTEYADSRGLSIRERLELAAKVCDAVEHAHQRGIIHRDLKPGNILVDAQGQPKVLDFGVARSVDRDMSSSSIETETGQLVGTLAYMSPEQVAAVPEAIDTRTDIHALGVILFRMLAGRLPFAHDDPPLTELARRILHDEPPRMSAFDPSLRGDLETIVARALAKEKERRYPFVADLARDLRRYLAGEPIAAAHDSTWYVVRRRLQRYRLALTAAAIIAVALGGLAFYASVQREEVQRQLAASTIERGRLLNVTGNLPIAEQLVWRELFRNPDSNAARWTLSDIYSREPSLWARLAHDDAMTLRFSPDHRHLLSAGMVDGVMHLWSTESGQIVRSFTTAPRSGTRRAFFTPDGSKIISGTRDGAIRVWDVGSGAVLRELKGFVTSLEDLAIVGQGASVATVGDGGLLRVWSLATGQLESDFSRDAPAVFAVAADPAGTVLVSGGNDGAVTAFDVGRRARLWRQAAHDGMVYGIAVSPSSHIVATGGVDSRLQIWNATSGQRLRSIDTENGTVRSLGFDPTGSKIAAAGHWRTTLWDLADASVPPRSFGSAEGTNDAQISDGMRLLATCHNGLLRLWDLTADARSDHWAGHRGAVTSLVAGIADGTMFSAGADGVVSLWQMGRRERTFAVTPATRVSALALSANRRWLSSVGQPGTAAVWDPQSGARITTLAEIGTSRAITFADADRRLIAGEVDGTIKMWDWRDDTAHNPRTFTSTGGEVLALASHGTQLFIAHRERVVVIRDAISGRELRTLNASHSPFSLAVTPDGRLLAAGTWSGIVDIWEIASGRKLHTLQGPTALVTALDINAQGTMLALSSRDGSTRLWDIAGAQWLATIATGTSGAERVRFLPDSRHLAIGYEDGGVEIRNIEHFFRHAAGHAEYQLQLLRDAGETFPDAAAVLEWSRQVLSLTR